MVLISVVQAAAILAAFAPIEAFMPTSTFGVKQVRGCSLQSSIFCGSEEIWFHLGLDEEDNVKHR
jgi:hypothetical protein